MQCFKLPGLRQATWGLAVCLGLVVTSFVSAQTDISGSWRGDLKTGSGTVTLLLDLTRQEGGWIGTIGVPQSGLSGLELDSVTLGEDGSFDFEFSLDEASFEGMATGSEEQRVIRGTWLQRGLRLPLEFHPLRADENLPKPPARPQTPKPPFAYEVKEVTVEAAVPLACTLTLPRNVEHYPAAVLLTVAGANDRDQTHSGHKPYLVLADHLTRNGIAVLRCDDRGTGGSKGDLAITGTKELTGDALAMTTMLKSLPGVERVGLIGNSEGCVIAAMAARASDEVEFVVMLGGVGVRGAQLIRRRQYDMGVANGLSHDRIETLLAPFDRLVAIVEKGRGRGREEIAAKDPELLQSLQTLIRSGTLFLDPMLPKDPEKLTGLFLGNWYYDQITLDGGKVLESVKSPLLALTGSLDRVNIADQNLPAIEAALRKAGNGNVTVEIVPGLNHLFQKAVTGYPQEYATLESSFAEVALERIATWIKAPSQPHPGDQHQTDL